MTHSRSFLYAAWSSLLLAAIASGCAANSPVAPNGPSAGAGTTSRNKGALQALTIPANTQTYAGQVNNIVSGSPSYFTIDTRTTNEGFWTDNCGSFNVYYDNSTQFDSPPPSVGEWIQVTGVGNNGGTDEACRGTAKGFSVQPSAYISPYTSPPPLITATGAVVAVNSDSFEMIASDAVTLVVLNSFETGNVSPYIGQIATVTGYGQVKRDIHATSVSLASAPSVPIYWASDNDGDSTYVSYVIKYSNSSDYISYTMANDPTYQSVLAKVGGWSHVVNLPTTICPTPDASPLPAPCSSQTADPSAHSVQGDMALLVPSNCPGLAQAGVVLYDSEQWPPQDGNLTTQAEYNNFQTAVPAGGQLVPKQTCQSGPNPPYATQYTYGSAISGKLLGISNCRLPSPVTPGNWSVNIFDAQSQALMSTNPADTCNGSVVTWLNGTRIIFGDAQGALSTTPKGQLWAEASLEKTDPQTLAGAVSSLLISSKPPDVVYLAAPEGLPTCPAQASPKVTPNPSYTPNPIPTCTFSSAPNVLTVLIGLGRATPTPSP